MSPHTPCSFTLVITGAPYSSQAPQTALAFARQYWQAAIELTGYSSTVMAFIWRRH